MQTTVSESKDNFFIEIPTDKIIETISLLTMLNDLSYSILHIKPGITTWHLSLTNALKSVIELQKNDYNIPFQFLGDNGDIFLIQMEDGTLQTSTAKINVEAPGTVKIFPDIPTVIRFIKEYRKFEKASLKASTDFIKEVFAHKNYCSHLCDQWKAGERKFGSFYLNLSYEAQILILHHWNIRSEEDNRFIELVKDFNLRFS